MFCLHTFVLFNVYTCNEMKRNKNISVKQIQQLLRLNLSTEVCTRRCACNTWDGVCGCERGGCGDGCGGDPVEEEPSIPVRNRACLVLQRFSINFPLDWWRQNSTIWFHPIQGDASPLSPIQAIQGDASPLSPRACTCCADVAYGWSLEGRGSGAGADKK